jgi:hypothetical protein
MTDGEARRLVERVMALWADPIPDGPDGEAAFGECYTDPLTVNGTQFRLADLVARARSLHAAHSVIRPELLQVLAAPGHVVVAFIMHVRHTGPLLTPLGTVPGTGREAAARTIDILAVRDGKITDVTVVSDELGLLTQLNALRLA